MVPLILAAYGWQMAFVATGALGLIWLVFWWFLYEIPSKKKKLSKAEFDHIHSDDAEAETVTGKPAYPGCSCCQYDSHGHSFLVNC